ncbi:MAG TPA: AAA family ATPase [Myxococcota bacterium]|nr:AAA family ATPase [Myxococcota bacterium]
MYLGFYGLREKPFSLSPDPRYLFLSASHREALAHLLYGIEEGEGFIEVIGQVGTGKTTLCRTLLDRIGSDAEIAYIFNPSPSEVELLSAINREFGLPTAARTRTDLLEALNQFLVEKNASGRRVLLVIDEAQNLDPAVLEQVRLLSNLETDRAKLLQIVLIGQPELEENLSRSDLRQLRQRITVRWTLRPLSRTEVSEYLEHRLRVAGREDPRLFTPAALRALTRASRGIPRLINALADRALLAGYTEGCREIDARLVRRAARELPATELGGWRAATGLRRGIAAVLVVLGVLVGLASTAFLPRTRAGGGGGAAAAPAAPAESATAPVSSAPPLLPARIDGLSANASAADALEALLGAWGYRQTVGGEIDPNLFPDAVRSVSPLSVFVTHGTPEMLTALDLPAILELEPRLGERRYVALIGMDDAGRARLGMAGDQLELDRDQLQRLWTGRIFYLWTNFESVPALSSGMKGGAVRWLQARLTELGYLHAGDATAEYDELTASAVKAFQTASSLAPSGEVGPETLIALYQALDYTTPRLYASGDES